MYKNKKNCVVVPAYNESTQINRVLESMPEFVDKIVVVNDNSKDNTAKIVQEYDSDRVVLINHDINQGVGGAIASGYKWARDNDYDVAIVMAGDGQMDPGDLPAVLDPVVENRADYSKGNRLFTGEAFKKIPKIRYFGNSLLSFFTKIASGYWHIADSQSGYTAINLKALRTIDWDAMYKRYGQPNDLLVRLNVYDFRVCDVKIKPVYGIGEISGIKLRKVIFTIGWLLLKRFFWRLAQKYVIRDFHPLVFFYIFGIGLLGLSLPLFLRFMYFLFTVGRIPSINFLSWMLCMIMGFQFVFFAMWFDMERNRDLKG
ncbi:glycosyltransferase family 2 protein [candidate division KSB1 bacterium]|nr:glycosyltransferase family 2 protein [candidate division KSB1 bacterium]